MTKGIVPVQGPIEVNDPEFSAGTASDAFYHSRMSPFRSYCRQLVLPFVKRETTFIHAIQTKTRHPILDNILKTTALTVTHTFNMLIIPLAYWFASPELARGFTIICLQCTYWTGFIKDFLCLPRPLSPPVVRLANSKYHNHEYGFPSTHTTTAVAYVLYFYSYIASADPAIWSPVVKGSLYVVLALYAVLIAFGRVYCGMHSVTDCVGGTVIGMVVWGFYAYFNETIRYYFTTGFWWTPLAVFIILILSQVFFPVPIEDCPCSDDSAVCMPTTVGMVLGTVHFASMSYASNFPEPGTIPYNSELGPLKSVFRFVLGVIVVFAWRILAKKVAALVIPRLYKAFNGSSRQVKRAVAEEEKRLKTSSSLESIVGQKSAVVTCLYKGEGLIDPPSTARKQTSSLTLGRQVSSFKSSKPNIERDESTHVPNKFSAPTAPLNKLPLVQIPLHNRGGLSQEYMTKMFVYTSLGYSLTCAVPVLFALVGLSAPPTRV